MQTAAKQAEYRAAWATALLCAEVYGDIGGLKPRIEKVFTGYPGRTKRGYDDVARAVACYVPYGTVIPTGNGIIWRNGSHFAGAMVHNKDFPDVLKARIIARRFLKEERLNGVWTIGGVARRLWDYIGPRELCPKKPYTLPADKLLYPLPPNDEDVPTIAHEEVNPGVYLGGTLYDVEKAYPQLMARIAAEPSFSLRPSPYMEGRNLRIDWGTWKDGERERFDNVLRETWELSALGRSLWGSALGGYNWLSSYCPIGGGESKEIRFRVGAGNFRSMALIVSRTMKDLCREQCEQVNAVYGTVDSFLSTVPDVKPAVWEKYGVRSRVKYYGNWDVCGRGCWAVWNETYKELPVHETSPYWIEKTDPYAAGGRYRNPEPREGKTVELYKVWL